MSWSITLDPANVGLVAGVIGAIGTALKLGYNRIKRDTNNTIQEIASENRLVAENTRLHTRLEAEIDKNARLVARINELSDIAGTLKSEVIIKEAEKRFLERDLASTAYKLDKADQRLTDEERGEVWKNTRPVETDRPLRIANDPKAPYLYKDKK